MLIIHICKWAWYVSVNSHMLRMPEWDNRNIWNLRLPALMDNEELMWRRPVAVKGPTIVDRGFLSKLPQSKKIQVILQKKKKNDFPLEQCTNPKDIIRICTINCLQIYTCKAHRSPTNHQGITNVDLKASSEPQSNRRCWGYHEHMYSINVHNSECPVYKE